MRPYFVRSISKNGEDLKTFSPIVVKEAICSKNTLIEIRKMLDSVVVHGTGKAVYTQVVSIAGKTGTAQLSKGSLGYKNGGMSHQVSFCGYFPADHPKYSAIVVIREPKSELPSGGKQAGGVFREIAERISAREWRIRPGEQKDSLRDVESPPVIKNGHTQSTKRAVMLLNVKGIMDKAGNNNWITSAPQDKRILLSPLNVTARLVPDVRGMGARDAVYLLGTRGLFVNMVGYGKVESQSIPPGSYYNRGQTIGLQLK